MIRLSSSEPEAPARQPAPDAMRYNADRAYHRGDRIRWAGKVLVHDGRQFVEETK